MATPTLPHSHPLPSFNLNTLPAPVHEPSDVITRHPCAWPASALPDVPRPRLGFCSVPFRNGTEHTFRSVLVGPAPP
eukprot:3623783-Prymnesium_polylepis.1